MTKSQIAEVLEEIATLLELKDENPFKIRAYANAARSLETFGGNLADLQDEEALGKIPGIGKAIAADAESLRRDLAAHADALQVDVAGSYRRRREIVRDVDLVVATRKPAAITKFLVKHALVESIIAQGPTKTSVRLRSGIQCDLRVVSSAEYPFALNYFTGSKQHNIEMRSRALARGWTLNEYRLARLPPDPKEKVRAGRAVRRPTIKIPTVRDEADLYR